MRRRKQPAPELLRKKGIEVLPFSDRIDERDDELPDRV